MLWHLADFFPQEHDFKVPVRFDTGSSESVGVNNATDAETFLRQARPLKERILLEYWHALGLQRQIRHFELLSDVVNTWDADNTQCQLRIEKICWGYTNLPLKDFPKEEPSSGLAQLQYFNKLEKKWSRRWVKLGNGSVRIAKKDKPREKDFTQAIGLDSFDVYYFANPLFPHERLKCPTKYCFALKSQHQQSLFGKDSVYCHYFAADNEAQMSEWYSLIRDFKSRLIAERRSIAWWTAESDSEGKTTSAETASPAVSPGRGRRIQKPLISPEELSQPPPAMDIQRSGGLSRERSLRQATSITRAGTRKNRSPSVRSPKSPESIGENESAVFFSGGLLGQDYEDRKRLAQLAYKEERAQPHSEYALSPQAAGYRDIGPRGPHQPLISMDPSSVEAKGLQRRETVASRPSTGHKQGRYKQSGTLLSFDEVEDTSLPHHRRGRGHTVSGQDAKSKGGLISFARSHINEAPPLPTSQMMGHMRPHTGKGRPHRGESGDEETAFMRTGLLSHGYHSAGASMIGHGVANGRDRNGGINNFLNPQQQSVFVPGSLLEKREREAGPVRPIIDRDPHSSDED